ncbi:hypothetical protein Dimus_004700 [Dionaea muscipula]
MCLAHHLVNKIVTAVASSDYDLNSIVEMDGTADDDGCFDNLTVCCVTQVIDGHRRGHDTRIPGMWSQPLNYLLQNRLLPRKRTRIDKHQWVFV